MTASANDGSATFPPGCTKVLARLENQVFATGASPSLFKQHQDWTPHTPNALASFA